MMVTTTMITMDERKGVSKQEAAVPGNPAAH
jgi:hypothetical protein